MDSEKVDISIIIPCMERPNFLAVTLDGLVKYSYHNLHVIVVNSAPSSVAKLSYPEFNDDYYIDAETGKKRKKYSTVVEMCAANLELVEKLNLTLVDVTGKIDAFRADLREGKIHSSNTGDFGGADIAYKNNLGIKLVDTPWVIPNWDDDFYPYADWDLYLVDIASYYPKKTVFIPRHVQPFSTEQIASMLSNGQKNFYGQPWFPMIHEGYVTETQWGSYCTLHSHDGAVIEAPGERRNCHYLPLLFRTEEFIETVGSYSYMGSGYELEMDNRCRDLGFQKVSTHNSFILHKGYVSRAEGDI